MQMPILWRGLAASVLLASIAGFTSCGGDGNGPFVVSPKPGNVFILTDTGRLISFDRSEPGKIRSSIPVTGLAMGETLLGMDFRPADGKLYALSSLGKIYTLNTITAQATLQTTLVPSAGDLYSGLNGSEFAVDFNPVPDRLRVVSNTGQNLRINVDTGATISDGNINGGTGTPAITAAAYTNSIAGSGSTALYVLDTFNSTLYLQNPPNNGTLSMPVSLGVNAAGANGFDIDASNNQGYAALVVGGQAQFYKINVAAASNAATLVGDIAVTAGIRGMALQQAQATLIGLSQDNQLLHFNVATPNTISKTVAIKGLNAGESVLGLDRRPADGKLYGLTSAARLFTVNPDTGDSRFGSSLDKALDGTQFAVDFNPVADRLRVISNTRQSLRINVDTGVTLVDGSLSRSGNTPVVTAAAYINSFAGTTSTKLFDIDSDSDTLNEQTPPNDGVLVNVGALGLNVAGDGGLDIAGGGNGLVLAALRSGDSGPYSLYRINTATGAATLTGTADASRIGGAAGLALKDLSIWLK